MWISLESIILVRVPSLVCWGDTGVLRSLTMGCHQQGKPIRYNIGMGGFLFPAMKKGFRNILLILIINSIHNTNFIKKTQHRMESSSIKLMRKKQSITLSWFTNVFAGVEDTIVQATHTRALIFQNRSLWEVNSGGFATYKLLSTTCIWPVSQSLIAPATQNAHPPACCPRVSESRIHAEKNHYNH